MSLAGHYTKQHCRRIRGMLPFFDWCCLLFNRWCSLLLSIDVPAHKSILSQAILSQAWCWLWLLLSIHHRVYTLVHLRMCCAMSSVYYTVCGSLNWTTQRQKPSHSWIWTKNLCSLHFLVSWAHVKLMVSFINVQLLHWKSQFSRKNDLHCIHSSSQYDIHQPVNVWEKRS